MNRNSGISWTHDTWNPWLGCDKVSEECLHCYIGRELRKQHREPWGKVYRAITTWRKPEKWQRDLQTTNIYMRMFTCSLSDFFHAKADDWRDEAWHIIHNTPNCVYLILTKRPERIARHLPADWGDGYPNVWLGTSIGSNKTIYRADVLRKVPAAVRFFSCEPLLEDISDKLDIGGIQWIIAGGESGEGEEYRYDPQSDWRNRPDTGRRTMKLEWAYKLYMAANTAGTPYFFKQVTATRSGQGVDKLLGHEIHEFPAPPNGGEWWVPLEKNPLVQIGGIKK